jgi:hypothetical protein
VTPEQLLEYINDQLNAHREQFERENEIGEQQIDREMTARVHLSDHIIRDTFNDYREFQAWCAHYNLDCIINGPLQDGAVVGRRWRVQRTVRIPVEHQMIAHMDWRETPLMLQDGDTLDIEYQTIAAERIAEQVDYELTEVFRNPNRDTVYIGLDNLGHPRPAEYDAQGGYIVPDDIAQTILAQAYDDQPEELIDITAILMEDEDIEWLQAHNPGVLDAGLL